MHDNFREALKAVLVHEGGFANNPKDPGGATMKGVTQRVYDAYRANLGRTKQSVALISTAEIEAIYRLQYWNAVKGDDLPSGLDYCVFDFAVNSGPSRAATYLQDALGVIADGQIGLATIAAANVCDVPKVINRIMTARLAFMKRIKHPTTKASLWTTFGKGWQARVDSVLKMSLALAAKKWPAVRMLEQPVQAPVDYVITESKPVVTRPSLFSWVRGLFGW
jgi:lysozyme family protein